MNRRTALMSAGALLIVRPSSAQEPASTLAVCAAILGIASSLKALLSENNKDASAKILVEINAKIDIVIASQQAILYELAALRAFIKEEFRQEAAITLAALKEQYIITSRKTPFLHHPEYASLTKEVDASTFRMGQYDYAAFTAFMGGVAMSLILHHRMGASRADMAALRGQFQQALDRWLDANSPLGVDAAIRSIQSDLAAHQQQVATLARMDIQVGFREDTSGNRTCRIPKRATADGDFVKGYVLKYLEGKPYDCRTDHDDMHPDHHGGPHDLVVSDQLVDQEEQIPGVDTSKTGVPAFDQLNAERNAAIACMQDIRKLRHYERFIAQARELLA